MIKLDSSLLNQLDDAASPVPICDADGRIVGHFIPEEQYRQWLRECYDLPLPLDELERRCAEPDGRTLPEIWERLGRQ
jgi:hypothetical protein